MTNSQATLLSTMVQQLKQKQHPMSDVVSKGLSPSGLRYRKRRQAEGKPVRDYVRSSDGVAQSSAELKRRYVAKRAKKEGRMRDLLLCTDYRPHDAHVKAFAEFKKAQTKERRALHDAHVKRYVNVLKEREKFRKRYLCFPDIERGRSRNKRNSLCKSYVVQRLVSQGFKRPEIDIELENLKREQLAMRRLSRELKNAANESMEKENESFTKHA